jgi:hypothetical protein
MMETPITVSEALHEALDFARGAWRDAWAAMALTAAGWAMIVVAAQAQLTAEDAGLVQKIGYGLLLIYLPLLGGLYRLGVGGPALRGLGGGGLQLGGAEWRLLTVNLVLAFFALLACVPGALASAGLYAALRRFDGVTLGPLGHWEWWFLAAAVVWVLVFAWLIYASGRLSLATPLSVDRRRIVPWESWDLTPGRGRTIALAFILAHTPALVVWLGLQMFGWLEPVETPLGLHGPWPLPEAIGAGVVAGLTLSVVQAPLSVGLLTFFYDMLAPIPEEAIPEDAPAEDHAPAAAEEDDAAAAAAAAAEPEPEPELEPEPEPEPEPDPPFSTVQYFENTGRYSKIAAPWLADEPVPEPYARLPWIHREAAEDAESPEAEPPEAESPEAETPEAESSEAELAGAEPSEPEAYPHSVVEYSPHSGRFSRVFAPWLAEDPSPDETVEAHSEETDQAEAEVAPFPLAPQAHEAVFEPEAEPAPPIAAEVAADDAADDGAHEPFPDAAAATLDADGEPEHAKS